MPQHPHVEKHFTGGDAVRDIVIGMSDGLTVPFALAAGLSGAVASTGLIVTAGMAEIAAGSIAMGLGGYLAARGDLEHYDAERRREQQEVVEKPEAETEEVTEILRGFGLGEPALSTVVSAVRADPDRWVDFMMRFELGLERPNPRRAPRSAFTIAASYVAGGLIPLVPYMVVHAARAALWISASSTLVALLLFGFFKSRYAGTAPARGALQTALVGGLAAAAAFALARLFA